MCIDQIQRKQVAVTSPRIVFDDIAHVIVSKLEPDLVTLASTALISRAFRSPCQKQLFRTIQLSLGERRWNTGEGYAKMQRLSQNPLLGGYVQNLSFTFDYSSWSDSYQHLNYLFIEKTLPLLSNLSSFSLRYLGGPSQDWLKLDPYLKSFLLDVCLSPKSQVSDLTLRRMHNLPLNFFSCCTHLKNLTLYGVELEKPALMPQIVANFQEGRAASLQDLEIGNDVGALNAFIDALTHPRSLLDLTQLRSLVIRSSGASFEALASRLIELSSKTLEYFAWDLLPQWLSRSHRSVVSLSLPQNIRALLFWIYGVDDSQANSTELRAIIHNLSTSPHKNLRDVVFSDVANQAPGSFWYDYTWLKQLDDALAGPGSQYKSRVRLTLFIHATNWQKEKLDVKDYYDILCVNVPLLHELGMFRVQYESGGARHIFEECI